MGLELDRLMNRFGVSSPTIAYSGGLTDEQKPAFDAYKAAYQERIKNTPSYLGAVGSRAPAPAQSAPGGVLGQFANGNPMSAMGNVTPGAQAIFNPLQAQQQGSPARTPANQQIIRDWFAQNPDVSDATVKAKQAEFGVTNPDLYAATGNYWGNTLRAPSFAKAPGDLGPPKPPGVASNGPNGAPGYVPSTGAIKPVQVVQAGPALPSEDYMNVGDDDSMYNWRKRDVRGYADGGMVDEEDVQYGRGLDLSRVTPEQLAMLQRTDPQALQRGVARFAGATQLPVAHPLQEMLEKYQNPTSDYAAELKTARAKSSADAQAFQNMLKQAADAQGDAGPSKSEMYFRLAAAFGSPTRTGSFGETLGNAANVLGQHAAETRQSQRAGAAQKLQLALEAQKAQMASSKEDLNTVRQLADEEMKGKRAEGTKLMEAYLKSGQPQSEAGKVAADAGLKPGTPEYAAFVTKYIADKMESGNIFKMLTASVAQGNLENAKARTELQVKDQERKIAEGKKLTPAEMKLKAETESALNTMGQAYTDLKRAEELNKDSFDTSLVDAVNYKARSAIGSKDPKTVNTGELNNLLKSGTIATAASTLKTQISDSDIKLLGQIQGLDAKSQEERARIIASAKRRMAENYKLQKKKLEEIAAGKYRDTAPSAPTSPEGLE